MVPEHFNRLQDQFSALANKLAKAGDSESRRALLAEIRSVLAQVDAVIRKAQRELIEMKIDRPE